jgi:hypothetical protein
MPYSVNRKDVYCQKTTGQPLVVPFSAHVDCI